MAEQRIGSAGGLGESSGRASDGPLSQQSSPEIVPRRTRDELRELAERAYKSGNPEDIAALAALNPSEKHFLATQTSFGDYCIALMFDAVIGNERVTKGQRAAAAWFHRVVQEHSRGKEKEKRGRIPEDARVVDSGEDD